MESIKKTYLEKELQAYKADDKNAILRHALVKNSLLFGVIGNAFQRKGVFFVFDQKDG